MLYPGHVDLISHRESGSELQLGAVSGSVALLQPGSELIAMAPIARRAMWIPWVWAATWGHVGV